jgi:L-fucose isomerase-like protein
MVESFALDTHFESGMGVGISARFSAQPVTLIRLGGADLDECWIAEGAIVATGDDADLCRTQVTIELSSGNVGDLLTHPLGNHLVLASGHHEQRLRSWWSMAIAG